MKIDIGVGLHESKTICKRVKNRDIKKNNFAKEHGFKIFYIWEDEIKNNKWEVMEKILNELRND